MNFEQQKKQARELLRAIRRGDAAALTRLRVRHLRWADVDDAEARKSIALHDAQYVLAREQGFSSWPKLKAYAEPPAGARHTKLFVADVGWIADRVQGLVRSRLSAGPAALEQIREWHPRFVDASDEEIRQASFSEDDARLVYAREHGFESWGDLESRVEAVKSGRAEEPFKAAFDAIEKGDFPALQAQLRAHPSLAKEHGTNGNTLLNLAGSIAARKKPLADLAMVTALLDAGADVNDANDRGWTPLHQAGYANQPEMAQLYIKHGADLTAEAHGAGGTPLIAALFWGHREAAEVLGRYSTAPNNLRVAAGLGRVDLIDACFSGDGSLSNEACAARGFYRPHSGFPD